MLSNTFEDEQQFRYGDSRRPWTEDNFRSHCPQSFSRSAHVRNGRCEWDWRCPSRGDSGSESSFSSSSSFQASPRARAGRGRGTSSASANLGRRNCETGGSRRRRCARKWPGAELRDNSLGTGLGNSFPGEVTDFRPRPGDIIILQSKRQHVYPSVSEGFVALYLDDAFFTKTLIQDRQTLTEYHTHGFVRGDIIVRMGAFDDNWRWHPAKVVQVIVCQSKSIWSTVAAVDWHFLPPLIRRDPRRDPLDGRVPRVPWFDFCFKPREGDLILRIQPSIAADYLKKWDAVWWHPGMRRNPFDILLRASFEASEDGGCNETTSVVEMYSLYDAPQYWAFLGRDEYTFSFHKNLNFAYPLNISRSDQSYGWRHVRDALSRADNKTFYLPQKAGKQKRVLDQPFDHHLPPDYDHLGFDGLEIQ